MAMHAAQDTALAHRANLNIAAAVVAKLGTGASDALIGNVINEVRASHPVAELASAGGMSIVVGAVDTAIARTTEADRPRNAFGAEAARTAQASGTGHPHGWPGDGAAPGRYGLLLGGRGGRDAPGESGGEGGSGSTARSSAGSAISGSGSEPVGAAFWGTAKGMLMTRAYANDNGMDWAPPDLMKMGRPALQALKESGLKGDGFKALRDPSGLRLDNATIVAGAAGYMKRNGVNHNEAAKSSAAVDRLAMPADMRERHRAAVEGIHTSTPENEGQRQEDLRKSGDEIVQHNPAHKAAVERERRTYKAEKDTAPKADATAKKDDVEAKQKSTTADAKNATADAKEVKAGSDDVQAKASEAKADADAAKLAEMMKKRRAAAASGPSGNG